MQRELGDVIWYWMQGCMVLILIPMKLSQMNIDKLKSDIPGAISVLIPKIEKTGHLAK